MSARIGSKSYVRRASVARSAHGDDRVADAGEGEGRRQGGVERFPPASRGGRAGAASSPSGSSRTHGSTDVSVASKRPASSRTTSRSTTPSFVCSTSDPGPASLGERDTRRDRGVPAEVDLLGRAEVANAQAAGRAGAVRREEGRLGDSRHRPAMRCISSSDGSASPIQTPAGLPPDGSVVNAASRRRVPVVTSGSGRMTRDGRRPSCAKDAGQRGGRPPALRAPSDPGRPRPAAREP